MPYYRFSASSCFSSGEPIMRSGFEYLSQGASLSHDGQYRYKLWREWEDESSIVTNTDRPPTALYIMLNPSTADADRDDATIRRCVGFAYRFGYARIEVVNLFGYRATSPKVLRTVIDPVGPMNRHFVDKAVKRADVVICAWGTHGAYANAHGAMSAILRPQRSKVKCFGLTNKGLPKHPLYLAGETKLVPFFN